MAKRKTKKTVGPSLADYAYDGKGHGSVSLWVGDAAATMSGAVFQASYPPFDCAFMDPPFNIGQDYDGDGGASDRQDRETFLRWLYSVMYNLHRSVRPGGALFFHLPDHLVSSVDSWATLNELERINWIILHQEFGQYGESRFISSKNHLLYYVKPGGKRTWNVQEILEPSLRLQSGDKRTKTAKYKGQRPMLDVWTGENLGRVQGNNAERRKLHVNQLPELYLARIIRCSTHPGDIILDPCVGSGTSLVVAKALGRSSVGIELNPKLAKSAWERVTKIGAIRDVAGPLYTPHKFE